MTPIQNRFAVVRKWQRVQMSKSGTKLAWRGVEIVLLLMLATTCAFAQAAAEYGSVTSGVAGSISGTNLMNKVKFPDIKTTDTKPSVIMSHPSKNPEVSPNYIYDTMTKGSVAENRKALEEGAGKNAAKLMLRSSPTDAYVKINGKPVGRTPLLLIVPPGQYNVIMDGKRMEHAERKVALLPKETHKCSLTLKQVYPTQVEIQLH